MSETTNLIAALVTDSLRSNLSETGKLQLDEWTTGSEANSVLLQRLGNSEERAKKISSYQSVDSDAIWNNLRARARNESGYELGEKPVPIVPLSRGLRIFLISVAVVAVMMVAAIFYMTIYNIKNHRAPVKSMQQRSFRF